MDFPTQTAGLWPSSLAAVLQWELMLARDGQCENTVPPLQAMLPIACSAPVAGYAAHSLLRHKQIQN